MRLRGVDISGWQGSATDWRQVAAAGYAFAFAKATEGVTYQAAAFADNWRLIAEAGLCRGAYHFARPSETEADVEAAYFVSAVQAAGGMAPGDLLALDMEDPAVASGVDVGAWALTWLRAVEAATGVKPLLYTGRWYLGRLASAASELATYGLWLAAYQTEPPETPAPWPVLAFWQHTDRADVPGVGVPCDADVFFGDAAQLRAYGKGHSTDAPSATAAGPGPGEAPALLAALEREHEAMGRLLAQLRARLDASSSSSSS